MPGNYHLRGFKIAKKIGSPLRGSWTMVSIALVDARKISLTGVQNSKKKNRLAASRLVDNGLHCVSRCQENITYLQQNGIEKLLHGLKTHKAAGPDGITPQILKHLAKTLAPILCNIFRLSYDRGEIPDDWCEANVVPIYKKGDKSTPANYRPISLTCICCKLMEHVLASNIMRFGDRNNIIFPLQFGFRKNMSCEQQLLGFVSDLHNNLDEGNQTDVLIMDFSKAFDKVGHQRLLRKLGLLRCQREES